MTIEQAQQTIDNWIKSKGVKYFSELTNMAMLEIRLGRPTEALPLLAEAKQSDPRTFASLYLGKPAPEQGEYFKSDYIVEYDRHELPKKLRMYGASDHAVSKKQRRDYTAPLGRATSVKRSS